MLSKIVTLLWALGFALIVPSLSWGYEVDNFTARDTLTRDGLEVLDRKVNHYLDLALNASNAESPHHCNKVILRQEILRWVRPDPISLLEIWATVTDELQRTPVTVKNSIYTDASFIESPAIWIAGIGRSLKVNGHVIGTDKIGHFFMQGHDYQTRVEEGASIDHVLQFDHGEDGVFGLGTTGVKSYGDMAANYGGYLFWTRLYSGPEAYFRCEDGRKWVRARQFTWADYVSDAWDEAVNCSEFLPTLAPKVARNLAKIGLQCPVNPEGCLNISRLEKSKFYMSPKCQEIVQRRTSDRKVADVSQVSVQTSGKKPINFR